ncbi:MAG: Eco57I restriction-modification methylase domain-containing protein, partial [Planctomycetaceae bacterium]|nr:Eco57I restriction-modification methylase domain-containing protein [Planctomycetaceae bacterium]
ANTPQDKKKLQDDDKDLRKLLSAAMEDAGELSHETAELLLQWNPYDQTKSTPFFDPHWMFGIDDGFDIVIGNPPYEEISQKDKKTFFQKNYKEVLSGHYDLYIFFFKRGIDLLVPNGIVAFITPHTFTQYKQFINLRKWLYQNTTILELTDRIEGIFESAVVDNCISILIKNNKQINAHFTKYIYENFKLKKIADTLLNKKKYSYESFDIKNIENQTVLKRFYSDAKSLGDVVDSSQGITVYAKLQGKKVNYFRDKLTSNYSKKCTRGREIFKYNIQWSNTYIKYGKWLWCPRNTKFFESPKIFLRQTSDNIIATYIEEPFYCIDSVHSLIQKDKNISLQYILGILNSKLGNYLYHLLISEIGKVFAQVKLNFLRQIPIKYAQPKIQQPIIDLVNQILLSKTKNPNADTTKLESEIDRLVYELYDLTEDEIKIIEG